MQVPLKGRWLAKDLMKARDRAISVALLFDGTPIEEVAKQFTLSVSRVHDIARRFNYRLHSGLIYDLELIERIPDAAKRQAILKRAERYKRLQRPGPSV